MIGESRAATAIRIETIVDPFGMRCVRWFVRR